MSSPEELYREREKMFHDSIALNNAGRIPVIPFASSYYQTRIKGISNKEAMFDREAYYRISRENIIEHGFDMAPMSGLHLAKGWELLGIKQVRWPGGDLDDNAPFQFVEDEYMTAEEYDEFLSDPNSFTLCKYWPRISSVLEPLQQIPIPPLYMMGPSFNLVPMGGSMVSAPPIMNILEILVELGKETARDNEIKMNHSMELAKAGYPLVVGPVAAAPFDMISNFYRGMKGTMLDMYRNPEKLLAAVDLYTPIQISSAVSLARHLHNPRVSMPLTRGADGFMSNAQFEKFYWPSLKKVILALIDEGLTPVIYFEGNYTPRLKYLAELPKGKVAAHFDIVDRQKFRKILGDTMCFWGNIPGSFFISGSPEQMKEEVKNLIDLFGDTGGLIIDGACSGIPDEAKEENVQAMVDAVHQYGSG